MQYHKSLQTPIVITVCRVLHVPIPEVAVSKRYVRDRCPSESPDPMYDDFTFIVSRDLLQTYTICNASYGIKLFALMNRLRVTNAFDPSVHVLAVFKRSAIIYAP